jgi:Ribonuclease G/E
MEKNLYIDASHPDETRVVLKSEKHIEEYEYENKNRVYLKNNIYLGKVSRIEPSLQAAFVNYGKERHGFLAFNDIQSDYYQIPHDDKKKLKIEEQNLRIELKESGKTVEETEKAVDETYLKNNIYLGKVSRIEPSLQAAFVNYGKQKHGFLAFNDIQSDYYQIPHADKNKLKKEEENLRLDLKEKNKNVEENEKKQDEILQDEALNVTSPNHKRKKY